MRLNVSLASIGASIVRGWGGGSGPPRNLARGVRVPVNYPQAPLIKRLVFVLYDGYS